MNALALRRVSTLAVLSILSLSPAAAAQRPPATGGAQRGSGGSRPGAPVARTPLLRGSVGNFARIVHTDPSTEPALAPPAPGSPARQLFLPLATSANVRRGLVSAVLRDMHRSSSAIERAIDRGVSEPVWDTLIIGGGVYGAATAQGLTAADPDRRVLTVEGSGTAAPAYGTPGTGLARTTREQMSTPAARTLRHPVVGGPVESSDLGQTPDPAAVSDAATIALHASRSDVLLRNHVERVEHAPPGSAARYLATVRNSVTGVRRQVLVSNVVVATRAGPPRVVLGNATSRGILQAGVDQADRLLTPGRGDTDGPMPLRIDSAAVPRTMTVTQALELARRSPAGRGYYHRASDAEPAPVTAVIGFDDEARDMADYLAGGSPAGIPASTRLDSASGPGGKVIWAVGNDAPPPPDAVRPEMFPGSPRLNAAVAAGTAEIVRARVVGVRVVTERGRQRFAITYEHRFGRHGMPSRTVELADRILVSSVGVEQSPADVLAGIGPQRSGILPPVVVGSRAVARRVPNESIFLVGPHADGIVPESEVGATGLTTAMESNLPRTTTFASTVLATEPRAGGDRARAIDVAREVARQPRSVVADRSATASSSSIRRNVFTRADLPADYATSFDAALRYEMSEALDAFRFPSLPELDVSVSRAGEGRVDVRVNGIGEQGARRVAAGIQRNPRLLALLERNLGQGFTTTFRAVLRGANSPAGLQGAVLPTSLSVTYGASD